MAANKPLDLSMDSSDDCQPVQYQNWQAISELKPLNLSPAAQQMRVVPTPPASPQLCIIQEENTSPNLFYNHNIYTQNQQQHQQSQQHQLYPQICLTDVQGSETTLVAHSSDNSRDGDEDDILDSDCDSIEALASSTNKVNTFRNILVVEPSDNMPSITRGTGRKTSIENDPVPCDRRGSDKSLGFSDDSLSNDSNNHSPSQEPSAASSGFKSGNDSQSETCGRQGGRLSTDTIFDLHMPALMSDECTSPSTSYEVLPLPNECSNLDSTKILEIVKQTIDSTLSPKGFVLNRAICNNNSDFDGGDFGGATAAGSTSSTNDHESIENLSLEYCGSGGLQIELQVCEGRNKDNITKGIKLRRISGDQFEYGKLCQQLLSTLTV